MATDTRISRTLALWQRHRPQAAGLTLSPAGWADAAAVQAALQRRHGEVDRARLERVVAQNDKGRFELSPDGALIRARQGHSLEVDLGWPARQPPERLYHGTVERFLGSILAQGLKPMGRHHVHLSPDAETARRVGARRGRPVVLQVLAGDLARTGAPFFLTGNGVWLTACAPPPFIVLAPGEGPGAGGDRCGSAPP